MNFSVELRRFQFPSTLLLPAESVVNVVCVFRGFLITRRDRCWQQQKAKTKKTSKGGRNRKDDRKRKCVVLIIVIVDDGSPWARKARG